MEGFAQTLQELSSAEIDPPHHLKARQLIESLGFPHRKKESYLHYPLPVLEDILSNKGKGSTHALPIPECKNHSLILENGSWLQEKSTYQDLSIYSLRDAYSIYAIYLDRRRQKIMEEKDPFLLSHLSTPSDGFFLYLPPNAHVDMPLEILSTITQNANTTLYLHMGEGAKLHLMLDSYAEPKNSFSNLFFDISLDEKAELHLIDRSNGTGSAIFHFIRATLKKEALFDAQILCNGGIGSRIDYKVFLTEEGAHAQLRGISQLSKEEIAHLHTEVVHKAPSATSKQIFRSIVDDKGQYRFTGKIWVDPVAQQTDSHQLCENLLLSEKAKALVQPNLEVFADDVKASHGATLSKLDETLLFYMKSRGISEKEAKELLVKGFAHKALDSIWLPSVKEQAIMEEEYDAATT